MPSFNQAYATTTFKKWRSDGIKREMQTDDGIASDKLFHGASSIRNAMLRDLVSAGLAVKFKKSSLTPENQNLVRFCYRHRKRASNYPKESQGS